MVFWPVVVASFPSELMVVWREVPVVWSMMVSVRHEMGVVFGSMVFQVMAFLSKWRVVVVCLMLVFLTIVVLVLIMLVMKMPVLISIMIMRMHVVMVWEPIHI